MRHRNWFGIILILLGLVVLLRNTGLFDGEIVLFIISLGFFGAYTATGGIKRKGSIGFLIPACILLSIGIFAVLQRNVLPGNVQGSIFFLLLGSAFFMIYALHTLRLETLSFGKKHWPAITGASLYVFGTLIFLLEYCEFGFAKIILQNLWPVTLILIGLIIILRNFRRSK